MKSGGFGLDPDSAVPNVEIHKPSQRSLLKLCEGEKMKKSLTYVALMVSLVLCLSVVSFGQETTGSIEGTVKDPTGALVPNVSLTVTSAKATATGTTTTGIGAGFKRTITTNDEGFFRILQVP